jgi:hypothetical protein
MKTTVEIADPLLEEAKREAQRLGVTLRELIERGLRRELDQRKEAKPFKLRDGSVGGQGVYPGVRQDDPRAMRLYSFMGRPGWPATVEEVNRMLDEEEEEKP